MASSMLTRLGATPVGRKHCSWLDQHPNGRIMLEMGSGCRQQRLLARCLVVRVSELAKQYFRELRLQLRVGRECLVQAMTCL